MNLTVHDLCLVRCLDCGSTHYAVFPDGCNDPEHTECDNCGRMSARIESVKPIAPRDA